MQGLEDCRIRERCWRNCNPGEHVFVTRVGRELSFCPILAVDGLEADREAPWLVRWDGPQEFKGLISLQGGQVLVVRAFRIKKSPLASKASPEIKGLARLGHFVTDAVLTDKSGMVSGFFQEQGIGASPCGLREFSPEIVNFVTSFILTGEDTCPAHHADGGSNKGIPEDVALRGEGIEMGGLIDLVSSKAKGVMTKVIDEQEKDVRLGSGFGGRREAEEEREDDRDSSHVRLLRGAGRRGDTKNTHPALITDWESYRASGINPGDGPG